MITNVILQVFKTEKRGWGIRTLHDIPQGAFLSVYVGNLYSSEEANKQGQNFGDEYFAELDMIEVIERRKDGYESDVSDEGLMMKKIQPIQEQTPVPVQASIPTVRPNIPVRSIPQKRSPVIKTSIPTLKILSIRRKSLKTFTNLTVVRMMMMTRTLSGFRSSTGAASQQLWG